MDTIYPQRCIGILKTYSSYDKFLHTIVTHIAQIALDSKETNCRLKIFGNEFIYQRMRF